jgi:hypothetical protein
MMNSILRDRVLLDLIERLEGARALLETSDVDAAERFPIFADSALRAAVSYLIQLREDQHVSKGR